MHKPLVSVLITTYNRRDLVKRAIASVLTQTFKNFELIIIDDASDEKLEIPKDSRIKYIYNLTNQGSQYGDRIHIKTFLELARGDYFIYLCDDDLWYKDDLLERQLELFRQYPNAVMVAGGQKSKYLDRCEFVPHVFPTYMISEQFTEHFANHPITSNIIVGATLYDKVKFLQSGALSTEDGSKWQAGYELFMGPGFYGDFVYIDEPCVLTAINPENASFQRTQREHYFDSIKSVMCAFQQPLRDFPERRHYLTQLRIITIENISKAYLDNAEHIRIHGKLALCSVHNISQPVTTDDVEKILLAIRAA